VCDLTRGNLCIDTLIGLSSNFADNIDLLLVEKMLSFVEVVKPSFQKTSRSHFRSHFSTHCAARLQQTHRLMSHRSIKCGFRSSLCCVSYYSEWYFVLSSRRTPVCFQTKYTLSFAFSIENRVDAAPTLAPPLSDDDAADFVKNSRLLHYTPKRIRLCALIKQARGEKSTAAPRGNDSDHLTEQLLGRSMVARVG
jgi:hypothetical protein